MLSDLLKFDLPFLVCQRTKYGGKQKAGSLVLRYHTHDILKAEQKIYSETATATATARATATATATATQPRSLFQRMVGCLTLWRKPTQEE